MRQGADGAVDHRHLEAVEHLANMCSRCGFIPVWGKPVIHSDSAPIRNHVAGDTALDAHRLQSFMEMQSLYDWLAGDVVH